MTRPTAAPRPLTPKATKSKSATTAKGSLPRSKTAAASRFARTYNSRGLLTKQEDGRGTLEYSYDKLGRETSLTDPQGKALSFAYDPEGDLTEVKRPSGVTTTNVFNDVGRLAETTSKDESSTVLEALKYAYDVEGNVTSRKDTRAETETTYAYDKLGRPTSLTDPQGKALSFAYDPEEDLTEVKRPIGVTTTNVYNDAGRLAETTSKDEGGTTNRAIALCGLGNNALSGDAVSHRQRC